MYKHILKTAAGLAAACLISTALPVPARPAAAADLPTVEVNGRVLNDDLTRIENNRLLIGLRSAAEALGATVEWDPADRRITMIRGENRAVLWIDLPIAHVNGQVRVLDASPRIVRDRTVVPYRFVGESLGARVGWDDAQRVAWLWSSLTSYTVQAGDDLHAVARRHGMTADQLRRVNDLHSDSLSPGQMLLVREAPVTRRLDTVSGYTVITGWKDTRSLESVRTNGAYLTDIATVSHRLRSDGTMSGGPQDLTLSSAREQGIRSWLVVQNLDDSGHFSRTLVDSFLRSASARATFAAEAVKTLKEYGFVGLELDLEDISPGNRSYYTLLVRELKEKLSSEGLLLSVAIPAKTSDSPDNNWNGAYDYPEIGKHADRVMLMTYDEHWFGGPSGPIASLPWVEQVLKYSTGTIPAHKTLLGIAVYAYDWPVSGGTAGVKSGAEAGRLAGLYGSLWDDAASSPFIRYTDGSGTARVIWYENDRSIRAKLDLATSYGLQGISIWRLGLEDASLWNTLNH